MNGSLGKPPQELDFLAHRGQRAIDVECGDSGNREFDAEVQLEEERRKERNLAPGTQAVAFFSRFPGSGLVCFEYSSPMP